MILLLRLRVFSAVLAYMFVAVFVYLWRDFRKTRVSKNPETFTPVKWARACLSYIRADLKIQGREFLEQLDWGRNVFFVSNHSSYYDIPSLIAASGRTIGFVAKYELTRNPLLGYWMRKTGCVAINRKEYTSAVRNLKDLQKLGRPSHLVIFPEGTRSKNGQMGTLKPGGIKIAWQLDSIIVPTHIRGTRALWEDAAGGGNPGRAIEVSFAAPIDLKDEKSRQNFSEFFESLPGLLTQVGNSH